MWITDRQKYRGQMKKGFIDCGVLLCVYLLCYTSPVSAAQYPAYCSKESNKTYLTCPYSLSGTACEYIKVSESNQSVIADMVWKRHDTQVEQYIARRDTSCGVALNITWTLTDKDWDSGRVGGFLLMVNFSRPEKNYSLKRFFRISKVNSSKEAVLSSTEEMFYYDCIPVYFYNLYTVELFILQKAYSLRSSHSQAAIKSLWTASLPDCTDVDVDRRNTWSWTATMSVLSVPEYNKLIVCFLPAPSAYPFSLYHLQLFSNPRVFERSLKHLKITADVLKADVFSCFELSEINAGSYVVWLYADSTHCECLGQCSDCKPTEYLVNVTEDFRYNGTQEPPVVGSIDSRHYTTVVADEITVTEHNTSFHGKAKLTGIVVGTAAVVLSLTCAVVCLLLRRRGCCRQLVHEVHAPPSSLLQGNQIKTVCTKGDIICGQVSVLIIYAHDNNAHRHVVQSLAAFLESCCGCSVILDEWCHDDIALLGSHEWLYKQLRSVPNVIIVHSELGFHQLSAAEENLKVERKVSDAVLEDIFVTAVRLLRSKALADLGMIGSVPERTGNKCKLNETNNQRVADYCKNKNITKQFWSPKKGNFTEKHLTSTAKNSSSIINNNLLATECLESYPQRYFHVVFPHSKDMHLVSMFRGLTFHLMQDIDHLFLDLHSHSKFSRDGVAVCDKLNAKDYNQSDFGKKLETAINEAVAFHSTHLDWFDKQYAIVPRESCAGLATYESSTEGSTDNINYNLNGSHCASDDLVESSSLLKEEDMYIARKHLSIGDKCRENGKDLESADQSEISPMDSGCYSAVLDLRPPAECSGLLEGQEIHPSHSIPTRYMEDGCRIANGNICAVYNECCSVTRNNFSDAVSLQSFSSHSMASYIPPDSISNCSSVSISDLQRFNESDYSEHRSAVSGTGNTL